MLPRNKKKAAPDSQVAAQPPLRPNFQFEKTLPNSRWFAHCLLQLSKLRRKHAVPCFAATKEATGNRLFRRVRIKDAKGCVARNAKSPLGNPRRVAVAEAAALYRHRRNSQCLLQQALSTPKDGCLREETFGGLRPQKAWPPV